ncbi:sphingosine 1-phosphate receptor 4 [Pseudonaja textilis]|uniref:sphingosine 1-phosphate receptor 4 n=1 Tax=Pseudonaja textilis TaxID=8673 RepID=UPI000EAA6929|nr:sphingosine 1-phosphate receptor 4 [Pseudonaja textilis]
MVSFLHNMTDQNQLSFSPSFSSSSSPSSSSSSSSSSPSSFPISTFKSPVGSVRSQQSCSLLTDTEDFNIILYHYNLTGRLSHRRPEEDHLDVLKIIIIAASCLIILENLVVLLAIVLKVRSRRWIFTCLASISSSDLLAGIAYLINLCLSGRTTFQLTPYMWFLREGILFIALAASIFSLLVTAIERFSVMVRPIAESESVKTSRLRNSIFFSWLLAFVIGLLPLLGWNCICDVPHCSTLLPLYSKNYILFTVVMFSIILVGVVSLYCSIYCWVGRRAKLGFSSGCRMRSLRLLKTVLIILFTFLVCWIPLFVLLLLDFFNGSRAPELQKIFGWFVTLAVFNSFINPIIYSLKSKEVRRAVAELLCCCCISAGWRGPRGCLAPSDHLPSSTTEVGSSLKVRESFRSPAIQKRTARKEPLSSNSSVLSALVVSDGFGQPCLQA